MKSPSVSSPWFLLPLVSLVHPAAAAVMAFNPVMDATLYQDPAGALSSGASTFLMTGRVGSNDPSPLRRALLQFDLSAIPAGATIHSAQLTLQLIKASNSNPTTVTLQRVTGAWTEGTTNAGTGGKGIAAQPGDATWLHRSSPTPWTTPGGDFLGITSSTLNVAGLGSYTWTGAGLAADVQAWLGNPLANFGWILRADEITSQSVKEFSSRQGTTVPVLLIDFTPIPEPSTAAAMLLAACGLMTRRRHA